MNRFSGLITAVLVLLFVGAVGFGSCLAGGAVGGVLDAKSPRSGIEGAGNTIFLGLGGWLVGVVVAIVIASRYLNKRGDS